MQQVSIKDEAGIAAMRLAGKLASEVLDYLTPHMQPGVTTAEIDRLAHDYMVNVQGTVPAPLHYAPPGHTPFPKSICTSVNQVICHGIPDGKAMKKGDVVNVDVTVIKDGWHGDTSRMFSIGKVSPFAQRLSDLTFVAMWKGIEQVRAGACIGDIGHAIQVFAEAQGLSVVREFCGHGIGQQFHEEPQILHYGKPGTGMQLQAGMTFTIEPMINLGKRDIRMKPDGWTVVTKDRSLSAQWEHTILVTADGYEILTQSAGTPAKPDAL